jgi:hypothetical protein
MRYIMGDRRVHDVDCLAGLPYNVQRWLRGGAESVATPLPGFSSKRWRSDSTNSADRDRSSCSLPKTMR